jgi:integrase/recombinase XerD
MERIERPRKEKVLIKPLSPEQLRALLGAIKTKTATGARDFAIICFLADSAARISEVLSTRLPDVDFTEGAVRVLGKGRKQRIVPIGQAARRAIMEWLKVRGEIVGQNLLFCNRFGGPLSKRRVNASFHKYGKDAGIEGVRVSAHTLRHSAAIMMLRNGMDPYVLQRTLGHESLEMTKRYCAVADSDVLRRHRDASPLDHMGELPGERRRVRLK